MGGRAPTSTSTWSSSWLISACCTTGCTACTHWPAGVRGGGGGVGTAPTTAGCAFFLVSYVFHGSMQMTQLVSRPRVHPVRLHLNS